MEATQTTQTTEAATGSAGDFDSYYNTEILPELEQLEAGRQKAVTRFKMAVAVAGLGALAFALGFLERPLLGVGSGVYSFGGFALMFAGIVAAALIYRRAQRKIKEVLVSRTCQFLGIDYAVEDFNFPFQHFEAAKIIPGHDRRHLEDRIAGSHDGVAFELCEAKLSRKGRGKDKSDKTVFRGLMLIYSFPKRFRGQTAVVQDRFWLGNKLSSLGKVGERVALEDPRFEELYEVYSTDQVEARYLLTPRFMERLTELADHFNAERTRDLDEREREVMQRYGRKSLTAAFSDNALLIMVRSEKNHFEGGSLFKPATDRGRADALIEEIELIHGVVDVLNLTDTSRA